MTSIWNLKDPVRTGYHKLARAGREKFGTVVRAGRNDKTVSVLVENWTWNHKYGKSKRSTSLFHCHDPENYCVIGDKVVIKDGPRLTPTKHYYIRNVVLPIGRNNHYSRNITKDEIAAMKFNAKLRERKNKLYSVEI